MTELRTHILRQMERLARLVAATDWRDGINPTQRAALAYLARANRFSRNPSAVTDYLAGTKGTVSQTLQALERKGLVSRHRSGPDRRGVRYDPTAAGRRIVEGEAALDSALAALGDKQTARLAKALDAMLATALAERLARPFGFCTDCRHFKKKGAKAGVKTAHYCQFFAEGLEPGETGQICREAAPRGD